MRTLLMITAIVCCLSACGQTPDDLWALQKQERNKDAMAMAEKMTKNKTYAADAYHFLGRTYAEYGRYKEAIPKLKSAIELDQDRTYISAWSHAYLGKSYFETGEREKAISEYDAVIRLSKTGNSVEYARTELDYIKFEPHWIRFSGKNIDYNFEDTTQLKYSVKRYIESHEKAYDDINKTFHAKLPRKMTFYIWTDVEHAKRALHGDLGFTKVKLCVSHVAENQTVGHEMTHTLSYWGWSTEPTGFSLLIMEGVAVAFDQQGNSGRRYMIARGAASGKNIHSILDVWKNEREYGDIIYPLGGAFVSYLYEKSTPEQFKKVIKGQTIDQVAQVYGTYLFSKMIKEFDELIGLH